MHWGGGAHAHTEQTGPGGTGPGGASGAVPSRRQGRGPQPQGCRTPGFPILAGNTTPLFFLPGSLFCERFSQAVLDNGPCGAGREEEAPAPWR